jgi:hypothetical protein
VLLERVGHMIMLERADVFHELLLDFAREVGTLGQDTVRTTSTDRGDSEAQTA